MFHPFLVESGLVCEIYETYKTKLFEPRVLDIVNNDKGIIEPFGELLDAEFTEFRDELWHNMDSFGQQGNDD